MERNLCGHSWIKVQVIELIWPLFCLRLYHVRLMSHPGFQLDRVRCRWSTFKVFFFLWGQISVSSERIQNNFFCCYFKIRPLAGSKPLSLWMAAFGHDPQLAAFHTYCLPMQVPCYCCLPTSTALHVALFLNISPPKPFFPTRVQKCFT